MTQQKGIAVCGVMVLFMLAPSHICNVAMDMVIRYIKLQHYMSKMGHLKMLYIFRTALPTIDTENADQLRSGHWLIEADGRGGQMSVLYDQVRLAATGIKLHVMLLV